MTVANRADIHEALARAYDKEDAAQRGESDPWMEGEDPEWRAERLACAEAALEATLPAIRRMVLQAAAWDVDRVEGERIPIPCPDGIKGCLVAHFRIESSPIATRLRAIAEEAR